MSKIRPDLDLSVNFRELRDLPEPLSPSDLFDREAPLEVEMGSGKGLFLQNACAASPEHDFLGIEVSHRYARHAAARLARRHLANGIVVHGDGLKLFRDHLPDRCAEAVHVYFPDPWWKTRHHKRRVMTEAFLDDVRRVLRPGGTLHFWTDVKEYFESSLDLITRIPALSAPRFVPPAGVEHEMDYRTHFERRTRLRRQTVYRAEITRIRRADEDSGLLISRGGDQES